METILDALWDFVKVRQLNFVVAATLTLGYLVYQYWGVLFNKTDLDDECYHLSRRMSRTRSRSRSKSRTRGYHTHTHNRAPRRYGRCHDCTKCASLGPSVDSLIK